tara:strand:+ start:140 stop:547 length:408 start_codon:yes stop_codon:yes gene_type:complete
MRIFALVLIFLNSSCVSHKYTHDFFLDCEKKFSEFNNLTSCALDEINKSCVDETSCHYKSSRFVEIIERLKMMVDNQEITENEAMFRYLNLIEIEESKHNFTNNTNHSYVYPLLNYDTIYSRGMMPFYFSNGFFY